MKTTSTKFIALIIVSLFAVSLSSFSQNSKNAKPKSDDGKMHIKIEIEKDGKVTKVDTTINPEEIAKLNEHLKDLDVHIQPLDEHVFQFDLDDKKLEEHMKLLEEHLKDSELLKLGENGELLNMEELEEHMQKLSEKMKGHCFMYKIDTGSDTIINLEELEEKIEKGLDGANFNFNFNDDGKTKTIIIDGKTKDKDKKDSKGEKKIIIKNKSTDEGKGGKQHKENKKVIIIMKSAAPEKKRAEFAAEPRLEKEISNSENARVRFVDKEKKADNSWLNDLTCYPNPSSGEFTLSFQLSNPEPAELKIMDITGREVFAENIPENTSLVEKQITLPSKSSAAYLLILRQGNNWHHEKIFVKS